MKSIHPTTETKTLTIQVKDLIDEIDRTHRYSMSMIYNTYNRVFATNETPQACASCLIRKVNQLKDWLEKQSGEAKTKTQSKKKQS